MPTLAEAINAETMYVKKVLLEGKGFYGVFSQTGESVAVYTSREIAFVDIERNDFIPASVH